MKIGIIGVGYQCEKISEKLSPFFSSSVQFYTWITSALFKENQDLGKTYENAKMEKELVLLQESKLIDGFSIVKDPILDFESRNECFNNLRQHDLDLVWQLDLFDEFYTPQEVLKTIGFIKNNPYYDSYHVNFKNYIGKNADRYVLDFAPPRINWVKKNGGLKSWYWDNFVEFNNGAKSQNLSKIIIPKNICNPKHLSWVGSEEFLKNKIAYQHKALGHCSYVWNEEKNDIDFDKSYYKKIGLAMPEVYHE